MNKKGKKTAYILMTFSFILIISGSVATFIDGVKRDREATFKRIEVVNDVFESFSTNTTIFENIRENLYEEVFGNIYFDSMYYDNKNVLEKISNYANLVDELEKNVKKLDRLCNNMYYPDFNTNKQCSNYKNIYEQINNYFVGDIKVYNNNITKYNEYQKVTKSGLLLKKIKLDKDYIDYNKDNKYDGKEE